MKIFDCITFFQENLITNIRLEILNEYVDYFVICESTFDHVGNKKNFKFKLSNNQFKDKIIYLILDKPFPKSNNAWQNQALQREFIFNGLGSAEPLDLILFSDPDEIPNPKLLKNLSLQKDYGIFYKSIWL